jgi:hypothetical protein
MQDSITHEALSKLAREYRPTMDKDIVHSWGGDAARALADIADALRTGQLIHAVPSGDEVEAVAELQLAAFLAGRGSVVSMEHGTRTAKPAPTMDEFRRMARTALDAVRGKQ